MDPIEAAIQAQLAGIQGQENFASYMPSNTLEPQGIAPLIQEQQSTIPSVSSLKDIAKNIAKNKALEYAGKKIGLNYAQSKGIIDLLGLSTNTFAPLAVASALSGRSLSISDYLTNKRAQKQALKRNIINDSQGTISTVPVNTMNMQPSAQDIARGGGNIPASTTAPSAPAARQSRQTSGIGGLHSGY
tara:strand:- start:138 stop:701 length:564 start_codon:yes stop_codon:yes gene_type:complete